MPYGRATTKVCSPHLGEAGLTWRPPLAGVMAWDWRMAAAMDPIREVVTTVAP